MIDVHKEREKGKGKDQYIIQLPEWCGCYWKILVSKTPLEILQQEDVGKESQHTFNYNIHPYIYLISRDSKGIIKPKDS